MKAETTEREEQAVHVMEKRKSWLCAFGLHKWRIFGYNSVLCPTPIERCERCGVGRQFEMYGGLRRYTSEQMDEMTAMRTDFVSGKADE